MIEELWNQFFALDALFYQRALTDDEYRRYVDLVEMLEVFADTSLPVLREETRHDEPTQTRSSDRHAHVHPRRGCARMGSDMHTIPFLRLAGSANTRDHASLGYARLGDRRHGA